MRALQLAIPWTHLEQQVRERAGTEVAALRRLTNRTLGLAAAMLRMRRTRGISELSEVRSALLAQIVLTARAISVVVASGYPLQAMSQLASLYELAAALAYAGQNLDRARAWKAHDSDRDSFPSTRDRRAAIKELLSAGGTEENDLESDATSWEARYRAYCMAKHGNPKVLKHYGIRRSSDALAVHLGPIAGGLYTELMKLVLLRSSQLVVMSAIVYGKRETTDGGADISKNTGRRALNVAEAVALASQTMVFAQTA